jgi:hypothetical protein
MTNLANTCFHLDRHDEAAELLEKALSLLRLVLDENDPALGAVGFASCDTPSYQACAGTVMKMLATTYGALGRIDESLALKEKTLEFELRVLPANHPHLGHTSSAAGFVHVYTSVLRCRLCHGKSRKCIQYGRETCRRVFFASKGT